MESVLADVSKSLFLSAVRLPGSESSLLSSSLCASRRPPLPLPLLLKLPNILFLRTEKLGGVNGAGSSSLEKSQAKGIESDRDEFRDPFVE